MGVPELLTVLIGAAVLGIVLWVLWLFMGRR